MLLIGCKIWGLKKQDPNVLKNSSVPECESEFKRYKLKFSIFIFSINLPIDLFKKAQNASGLLLGCLYITPRIISSLNLLGISIHKHS